MCKSVPIAIFIFFNLYSQNIFGQVNLITNGSFENYVGSCPTFAPNGALSQVLNWRPANVMPTHGVPHAELYCGGPNYGNCLPGPFPLAGSDGLAYVGFHTRILNPVYNEAIYQVLNTPLVAGNSYTISLDLMNCQSGLFTNGPSDFCVYTNIDTIIPGCPTTNPAVVLAGCIPYDSISNVAWKHHSFSFVAAPDANIIAFSGGSCFTSEIYYYVDNIILTDNQHQVTGTCYGDSTFFSILDTVNLLSADWNFDDPASGINNLSSLVNPVHLFSVPGSYNVQLVKNYSGSTDTLNIVVTIYAKPTVNLGADSTLCPGDTLVLNAGSGYTAYLWQDNSADSLFYATQTGTYSVKVTENNCAGTDTVNLIFSPCNVPVVGFYSSDTLFCDKKCIDFFDISTNSPTTWIWLFPGADSTTSNLQHPVDICYNSYGTFDVTLIACNNNGCDTLALNGFIHEFQPPPIPVITANFDTLFCTPAYTYQWYNSNGIIAGATNQFYVYPQQGSYSVIVTDSNGCASSSNVIFTSLNEFANPVNLQVFPNPVHQSLEIIIGNEKNQAFKLRIFNAMGQEVWQMDNAGVIPLKNLKLAVNTEFFAAGIYMLSMETQKSVLLKQFHVVHY